jgi:glycerol uptake facilitator-like aquaporin
MDRSLRNALIAEFFGTFLFLSIGAGAIVTTTRTSSMLNPARWFGPAIASGYFDDWYVWIVGPVLEGLVVGALWRFVLGERSEA